MVGGIVGRIESTDVPLVSQHAGVAAAGDGAACGWSVIAGGGTLFSDMDGQWPGRRSMIRRPPRIAGGATDRSIASNRESRG